MAGGEKERGAKTTISPRRITNTAATELQLWTLFSPDAEVDGQVWPLRRRSVLLGREVGEGHLGIGGDRALSRIHASITLEEDGGELALVDLESANGSFLNGRRVERAALSVGDVLRLGDTVMQLIEGEPGRLRWRSPLPGLVAGSPAMRRVLEQVELVAPSDVGVLITGETGTGKDVVARAIHGLSGVTGPFLAVNCATLRPELSGSELFGHVKGAFSGADREHRGMFAGADGGTLFLDEVGELPPEVQAQLRRTLGNGQIRPVGGTRERKAAVRVLAASNLEMEPAMQAGAFRPDLYARLAGGTIHIPPLRGRLPDVPLLADHFLAGIPEPPIPFALTGDAVEALCLHRWKLNVRELASVIRRLALERPRGGTLDARVLPREIATRLKQPDAPAADEPASLPDGKRGTPPGPEELITLLEHFRGNVSQLARHVGRHRVQVHRWLKQHDLDASDYRGEPEP